MASPDHDALDPAAVRAAVVDHLGVVDKPGRHELETRCFNPEHHDARASASIYVGPPALRLKAGKRAWRLPGMWVCYSCGAHGSITEVLDGVRIRRADPDVFLSQIDKDLDALETPQETRLFPEAWLDLYDTDTSYWHERGFPDWMIARHRLGFDFFEATPTYPMRDEQGRVLGVVRRRLGEGEGPKYRYPAGVVVHNYLYGYHLVQHRVTEVVLTEGAIDAMSYDEVGITSLAIYGSQLSVAQVALLRRLNPISVILAFDMDEAGHRAATHAVQEAHLEDHFVIARASWDPVLGKDPAELTKEQRRASIASATLL